MTTKAPTQTFSVKIIKNTQVSGAWLCRIKDKEEESITPWSNVSAAKRYVKAEVLRLTPRKSIKLEVIEEDEVTGKPLMLEGSFTYKEKP